MADAPANSHPTGGRRRKYKGPAAQTLPLDLLQLPEDSDVSSDGEAEKEAKRPRSVRQAHGSSISWIHC